MTEEKNDHGISIVACTNKMKYMDNIFANYANQTLQEKELIIVLNNDSQDINEWKKRASEYKNVRVFQLPEETSLGNCLNFGREQARLSYVAKWDDDDYYGSAYLQEALQAFERTNADIIGKRTGYMYFQKTKELRLRFPGYESKRVRIVLGGTIIAKKSVMEEVPFLDRSLGEDVTFQDNARAKGYRIFSTSRYNYTYFRWDSSDHTWKPRSSYLNRTSRHIGFTDDFKKIVDKDILE
ncbi:glycosyltransferase family 2 protein [Bacillus sp. 31A1R]|uniref:Glycosyltransferase family 2 protein n=1 Tax=Robertmurraya mangrovi TaxID=3098077 RepID=A0ABU5IW81_9BACI|nr:glycosyltransferase family 2 protein [Bacillus sp. 31A1R]MDZ5471410.1 glycosyltransferase family 2 protein [Bacillus sp. 31A1R]